jgi:endonuclease/exonuclease/phosphatase family metal-dependent hydrolase
LSSFNRSGKICAAACALIVALAAALALLAGCTGVGGPSDGSSGDADSQVQTEPSLNEILMADLEKYIVIRPDVASDEVVDGIGEFYYALKDALPVKLTIKDDFLKEGDPRFALNEFEILLGKTNREESKSFIAGLRPRDYGYAIIGKKLVIAGGSDESTVLALRKFMSDVVGPLAEGAEVFFSASSAVTVPGDYAVRQLSVGGVPIGSFTLVYAVSSKNGERLVAESVRDTVLDVTGVEIPIYSDKELISDKELAASVSNRILVGSIMGDSDESPDLVGNEYIIGFDGKDVRLIGLNAQQLMQAAMHLTGLMSASRQEKLDVKIGVSERISFDDSALSAMTFNVLVNTNGERQRRALKMVENYMPDTVGFQEASPSWMRYLETNMRRLGYEFVGEGRNGGDSGEYNPIFYNAFRFKVLESGTRWLSPTPEKPSKFSNSSLNRIYTYALLERLSDGVQILVVNTHLDHSGSAPREKQATVLAAFIKPYMEQNMPIVLTGDFNTSSGSTAYKTVIGTGLANSSEIALSASRSHTYSTWGDSRITIDFLFVNAAKVYVSTYRVCTEQINGDYCSDHYPVFIEYSLKN